MDEPLTTPPTEREIAELIESLVMIGTGPASKRMASVVRRLAFQRDMKIEENERFKSSMTAALSLLRRGDALQAENDLRRGLAK